MKGGCTTESLGFLTFITGGPTEVVPVISTLTIKVIGAAMQNDGIALQPGILFDEALKCNVGLETKIDIQFVETTPPLVQSFLRETLSQKQMFPF